MMTQILKGDVVSVKMGLNPKLIPKNFNFVLGARYLVDDMLPGNEQAPDDMLTINGEQVPAKLFALQHRPLTGEDAQLTVGPQGKQPHEIPNDSLPEGITRAGITNPASSGDATS